MTESCHYRALLRCSHYLTLHELQDGGIYLIHARNSHVGIWDGEKQTFFLYADLHGTSRVTRELHWDTDENHGTVKPFILIGELSRGQPIEDTLRANLEAVSYAAFMEATAEIVAPPGGPAMHLDGGGCTRAR